MSFSTACIAGEVILRQIQSGKIKARSLGHQATPFGPSGEIFSVQADGYGYYLLSRYQAGQNKTAPSKVNYRANIYALKDLGVSAILGWGSGGAITHNITVGDLVILSDVIDFTKFRPQTFFEEKPYGYLRQFPVFCPRIKKILGNVLHEMKLIYHGTAVAACTEGPRLETPSEIHHFGSIGAEVVTHTFVPEMFLARELQICYAGICYIVNFAETGSRQQPFIGGGLFGEEISRKSKLTSTISSIHEIISSFAQSMGQSAEPCRCAYPMNQAIEAYDLGYWKTWFE